MKDPNPKWAREAIARLQDGMTEDLLKPEWRGGPTRTAGHCYAASEAMFHALGKQDAGWKSMSMRFGAGTHWFLLHKETGVVLDPTWDQFGVLAPYAEAKGTGFLTREPSKRAQTLMDRAGWAAECLRELAGLGLALSPGQAPAPASKLDKPTGLAAAASKGPRRKEPKTK